MSGKLLVIATPLGNLDDLSPRAAEALRSADAVACEDTRRTSRLMGRFGIETPLVSCHRFNERGRSASLLERLRSGQTIALVADGGTPGISDPGALLVRAALDDGIDVSPVPGPSAVTALLSASGLPADRYLFEGFLPHRGGERRRRLREWIDEPRTIVFFETPHRISRTLADIAEILGSRRLVLGRELTKIHESVLAGTAEELARTLGETVRGELTLVLAGADATDAGRGDRSARELVAVWHEWLERSDGDRRTALGKAARSLGLKKAALYRRLSELGEVDD